MHPLKCLIIDDEPLAQNVIENYLKNFTDIELIAKCENALSALVWIKKQQIDLIFLDISMPFISGIDFIKTLQNPPKIILTTAHKEFAVESYELNVLDYLLKPISLERFIKAVNKVCNWEDRIEEGENKVSGDSSGGFLYLRAERKMVKVVLDHILYVESLKDYIRIISETDKPLIVKRSISSLEEMLPANKFMRIHRSYIVAIQKITAFTQQDIEIGGIEIPIGRAYSQQVKRLSNRK